MKYLTNAPLSTDEYSPHGRPRDIKSAIVKLILFIGLTGVFGTAFANPQGGVVVGGNATITNSPGFTQIHQTTDKAIIDWRTFNIGIGEHTNFSQPSSSSIALNRINAAYGASQILGKLTANGQVWLINPAGIFFGKSAQVDVAGLVATTANIKNEDFMAGNYKFQQSQGYNAGIVNEGKITAAKHGLVALVAPAVANRGIITANMGKVALAAGTVYTLDMYGDRLIHFGSNPVTTSAGVDPSTGRAMPDGVLNAGKIIANAGSVQLSARTAKQIVDNSINMTGIILARSARADQGEIILSGGDEGVVNVSGKLIASGMKVGEKGGKIQITGQKVGIFKNAVVNVSGDIGGGEILIGGDYQGKNPLIKNAEATYIGPNAIIKANAITKGDGGKVIVWANDATQFYGTILARGGLKSGNGGFVETSGKEFLHVGKSARVDTSAPKGKTGTWLLDPQNIIVATGGGGTLVQLNPFASNPAGTVTIDPVTINAAVANVLMQANNDITFTNAINMTNAGVGLTAQAGRDININNSITTNGGAINFTANDSGAVVANRGAGTGDITAGVAGAINSGGAAINLTVAATTPGFTAGSITLPAITSGGGVITVNSPNTLTLNGAINSGAGQVNLTANSDGSGANNFTMAAGSSITTTNAPVIVNVNTSAGGTGSAALRNISTGGGMLTVATDTGNNATGTAITQSAGTTLNVGAANFSTGNGAITLTQANDFTGNVVLSTRAGNSASITDSNSLSLGNSNIGVGGTGNLTVNATGAIVNDGTITVTGTLSENTGASGSITQNAAPLTITGTSTFAAGAANNIILGNTSNNFSNVVITSGNNVTLGDTNALIFGASTISGTLDVTTNGAISQTGTLIVAGTATFAAGAGNNITLNTATNNFNIVGITSGNTVSLRDTNALVLAPLFISGNLTVQTAGALTQTGGAVTMLTPGTTTTLIAGAGNNITLGDVNNDFHNLVITSGNAVTLVDNNALNFGAAASTVSGALNLTTNGAITQTGTLSVSGIATLAAGAANDITLNNAGNNFSSVAISSGHDVHLRDTNSLTLNASTISGLLNAISATGMTIAGAINANDDVTLQANNGGAGANNFGMNLGSSITSSAGDVGISVNNGGGTGTATIRDITASAGKINVSTGTSTGGTLTQSAGTTLLAANDITLDSPNAMTLSGTTHTTGSGSVIINSNTDGSGANNFSSSAGSIISDNGDITIVANAPGGTGTATFGTVTATNGAVTIRSGTTTGGTLTQTAGTILQGADDITLESPNAMTLSGTTHTTGSGSIIINSNTDGAGANNFSSSAGSIISDNGDVTIVGNAAGGTGAATFGNVSAANGAVDISAGSTTGGTLTQTSGTTLSALGNITLNSPNAITLNAATSSTGGAINIAANTNGAGGEDFTMNAGSSLATAGGAITIDVNALAGGTGNAVLRNINTGGGTLTVATDTGGNVTGSSITQGAGTTLSTGVANFSTGSGAITLNNANDFTGAVKLTTHGANNAAITDINNIILDASTLSQNLNVTTSGAITQTGAISVAGTATFAAGAANDITLDNSSNSFNTVAITSGNNVTLDNNQALNFGTSTVSGNLTADVVGAITQTGALNVAGILSTQSSGGTVLNNAGNAISGFSAVNSGSGNIELTNTASPLTIFGVTQSGGGDVNIVNTGNMIIAGIINADNNITLTENTGDLTINSAINGSGSGTITFNAANGINLNADVNSSSGDQIYNNAITLGAPIALSGNNMTFNSNINGNQNLTLNAGSLGNIIFNADVGNVTSLNLLTIANAHDVTNNAIINVTAFLQLAGSGLTSLGAGGLQVLNSSGFITNDVTGLINSGSLALGTNAANLIGTVNGSSGLAGAEQIVLLNTITLGTHFFDGIDLASLPQPTPTPTPVVPPVVIVDDLTGLRNILSDQDAALRYPDDLPLTSKKICTGLKRDDCIAIEIKKIPQKKNVINTRKIQVDKKTYFLSDKMSKF